MQSSVILTSWWGNVTWREDKYLHERSEPQWNRERTPALLTRKVMNSAKIGERSMGSLGYFRTQIIHYQWYCAAYTDHIFIHPVFMAFRADCKILLLLFQSCVFLKTAHLWGMERLLSIMAPERNNLCLCLSIWLTQQIFLSFNSWRFLFLLRIYWTLSSLNNLLFVHLLLSAFLSPSPSNPIYLALYLDFPQTIFLRLQQLLGFWNKLTHSSFSYGLVAKKYCSEVSYIYHHITVR